MSGEIKGSIKTAKLVDLLGAELVICRSDKAKRYPLYLSTPFGPVFFNTTPAQDFLLEHGHFHGAGPEPVPAPEPEPTQEGNPEPEPEPQPEPEPEPEPKPRKIPWYEREII